MAGATLVRTAKEATASSRVASAANMARGLLDYPCINPKAGEGALNGSHEKAKMVGEGQDRVNLSTARYIYQTRGGRRENDGA